MKQDLESYEKVVRYQYDKTYSKRRRPQEVIIYTSKYLSRK